MGIHPYDDFPFHQAPLPFAQPVDGDPNRYDRYFFHGYDASQDLVFVVALGIYPNREIIDGAFCVSHGGRQESVYASGRLSTERVTHIGPIIVEVVEPLRQLHVIVDAPDEGLFADITFEASTVAYQEPRQTLMDRNRVVMDSCRFTQFGRWSGRVRNAAHAFELDPATTYATRDRSWGIRPLAGATPAAPSDAVPGIWWMWTPLQLDDGRCVLFARSEAPDGSRTLDSAAILTPVGAGATHHNDGTVEHPAAAWYDLSWQPSTRRAEKITLTLERRRADRLTLELEPIARVFMRGVGYTHLEWSHGAWHGEEARGAEQLDHADIDPWDFTTLHVQQLVRVSGDATGWGMAEQLCIGPHEPTGLTGFNDPVAG